MKIHGLSEEDCRHIIALQEMWMAGSDPAWLIAIIQMLATRLEHTEAVLDDISKDRGLPVGNIQSWLLREAEDQFLARRDVIFEPPTVERSRQTGVSRNDDNMLTAALNAEIRAVAKRAGVSLPAAVVARLGRNEVRIMYHNNTTDGRPQFDLIPETHSRIIGRI